MMLYAHSCFPNRPPGTMRRTLLGGRRMRNGHIAAILCPLLAAAGVLLAAMPAPAQETLRKQELEHLQQRIEKARDEQRRLEREREALRRETERISADMVRLAARVQALEQRIARAERRIGELEKRRGVILSKLSANRATTARLLAALQRLKSDPPPPFVTNPQDVLKAVRGALAMGAVLPGMRSQAEALRHDLEKLARVQRQLREERESRRENLSRLREATGRLQGMLKLKRELLARTESQLDTQRRNLALLLKQAKTLQELIATLERERQLAEKRHKKEEEETRKRQERQTAERQEEKERAERPVITPRPAPRVSFASLKGRLPWPAQGRRLVRYGQETKLLGRSRGIYLATLANAVVTAPVDAKVEVAGPFRTYGKLVILDAGKGYRILLAGLHELDVKTGELIRAGEPVGRMGTRPAPATVPDEKVDTARPILYMELRHGNRLMDPSRWLAGGRRAAAYGKRP